jgi:hypothetical protein
MCKVRGLQELPHASPIRAERSAGVDLLLGPETAEHALEYEQQTFTCFGCEREFKRVVDERGERVRSPAFT